MSNSEYLKLVDENAKWIKSVRDDKLINLNYDKFKKSLKKIPMKQKNLKL